MMRQIGARTFEVLRSPAKRDEVGSPLPFRIRELYSTNGAQHTSPGQRPGYWRFMNPEPCKGDTNGRQCRMMITLSGVTIFNFALLCLSS